VTLLEEKSKIINLSRQGMIINQGTEAWHHSSTIAQSGIIPFLGGNKKRGPFLGTFLGKQKGTEKKAEEAFKK
jgi:hypothetical protein